MIATVYGEQTALKDKLTRNVFSVFTNEIDIRREWNEDLLSDIIYARYVIEDFAYNDKHVYAKIEHFFLESVVPHKIAVFAAGLRLMSQPWFDDLSIDKGKYLDNLWLHDISKFSANEAIGYAMHDFTDLNDDMAFEVAWHHHKMHNEHHPEYWLNPNRSGKLEPIPMERIFIAEMVADWVGAGDVYGTPLAKWLPDNIHKFEFHPETAYQVVHVLNSMDKEYKLPYKIIMKEESHKLVVRML